MKKQRLLIRTFILLLLGAAVAYTLYANFTKDEVQKVEVGKKAPDFVLTDLSGEKHQLSDYEGEGVLLNFWATWCKPCEKEMPYLNNQYQAYKDQGVHVIAVNIGESNVAVSDFSKRYDLQFPIVTDKDSQVMTAYGVDPLPITFLIDKQGNVVEIHKGQIIAEADVTEMMEKIKP
jgi:peroxiredoxin